MPPQLASLLTWGFIFWLFRRDIRQKPNVTNALWIPFFFLVISMSRFVSMWLGMFGIPVSSSLEEGTPVDALYYLGLLLGGCYVLSQRRISLGEVVRNNVWLTLFLGWCFISIAWSDFPFISFKRWIKVLSHPIMALVILTEPDPKEAIIRLLRRLAYVLIPLSVLFIKYYPEWGRSFSDWTGHAMNSGVTTNKNDLGVVCLIFCYFFVWYYLQVRQMDKSRLRRDELLLCLGFLGLILWLFNLSNSKTPLVGMFGGLAVMLFAGFRLVNPRQVGAYILLGVGLLVVVELTFGVYDDAIRMLGRESTLTDRTKVWADVLRVENNPVVGAGFESFWLGERLKLMWAKWPWKPNQAHNGYIETYLHLGLIGLFLMLGMIAVAWRKTLRTLMHDLELGRFGLGILVAVVLYNWTESSFKATHPLWTLFYLIALERPLSRPAIDGRSHHSEESSEVIPELAKTPGTADV